MKAPQRELDQIAAKLRSALQRQTKNIIEIGDLLIKSREHLDHGEWQRWLAENFDLSYRSALRYEATAKYVARKSDTVSDFTNVAPTVLYRLADGGYTEQEEAEILGQAKIGHRIDQDQAWQICEALALDDDDDDDGDSDTAEPVVAEDPDVAAILDGPPPMPPAGSSENR